VALLVGTPGTGKTFATAAVVKEIIATHGDDVAVCAPTGKAAVRLTQAMARYGIEGGRAVTIHQLLEIGRNGHDGDGWAFRRNANRPLVERFVIVDEASMLDTQLFAALLRACGHGTHLLLVGDPNQLPPVGHGSPLRDLITAGVPCATLTEVRRNGGEIVEACAAIRQGQRIKPWVSESDADGNLRIVGTDDDAEEQLRYLQAAMIRQPRSGFEAMQVIVATNSGPLGRDVVNERLQAWFNSGGHRVEGNPYRVGDKVICLKNGWYRGQPTNDDAMDDYGGESEIYLANGEMGTITHVAKDESRAEFPGSVVLIPNRKRQTHEEPDGGAASDFALGYAITCHKSQGSEWPVVFVLIDGSMGARNVCSREWLYTAISRAAESCVLVGKLGVAEMMIRRPVLGKRKTFLVEELCRGKEA
jgi:exodeoxyribonuclease V alpha subunit